tara:strand:- start:1063 stop:4950 length:3888 start_codon:yes stop_codon:yes gene_type:complete
MKITLVESILAVNIPILDTSDGAIEEISFPISVDEPLTLTIPDRPSNRFYPLTLRTLPIYVRQQVKLKLRERVVKKFRESQNKDISVLVGEEEDSPPRIVYTEKEITPSEYEEFVQEHTDATYQVVKTSDVNLNSVLWGQERVWRQDAPRYLNYNQDILYQRTDDNGLTCAYDYIHTKFNKAPHKKLAKSKGAIDNAIQFKSKKGNLHDSIFKQWLIQYRDKLNTEDIVPKEIYPLPEIVEVGDLHDEMYKIEELDIDDWKYNSKETDETLSVMDIVKWCIVANVRLNVFDYDNSEYLSYNPADFQNEYRDVIRLTNKRTICVKIANKHAYFVEDADVKRSVSVSTTRRKLSLCDVGWSKDNSDKKIDTKEELDNEYHIGKKWVGEGGDDDGYEHPSCRPPPTQSDLYWWMKDEETLHHYYVGLPNINALVSDLYRQGIVPDKLTGSAHSIKVATFGNLKIYCWSNKPKESMDYYDDLYEHYPELKSNYGIIPTDTTIANHIYEKLDLPPILSMLNSQVRRMFFESEIKPDNRYRKNPYKYDINPLLSFDINKAYTTALEHNEYKWNVYDAVSQPQRYKGEFNPDYFYLAYNKIHDYPCIRGSGLLLYHGSMLKYLLDKVDIMYYINPVEQLSTDHFKPFVDKCKWVEEELGSSYKTLINRFIGDCKKKGGIQQYGLYINQDKVSVKRQFLQNYIPSRLENKGMTWKSEPILTSRAQSTSHFETAQPIRLQVISMCNEMLYKVYLHYRKCLYVYKFVNVFQNTLKNRKILTKIRHKKSIVPKPHASRGDNYYPHLAIVNTDALKFRSPNFYESWDCRTDEITNRPYYNQCKTKARTEKFANWVVDEFNRTSDTINIKFEGSVKPIDSWNIPEVIQQNGMKYIPNRWETNQTINHKWDKKIGGKLLGTTLIKSGGGWVAGLGGRGKSELIKCMRNDFDNNQKDFKWVKLVSRMIECNRYDFQQSYLKDNPVSYEVLAPTNKSANIVGGKTLHKGLGINHGDIVDSDDEDDCEAEEVEVKHYMEQILKRFEGNKKECIHPLGGLFVDELSMVNGVMLSYLAYIKERIPTIKFFLFGDIEHQLPPVKEEQRNFNGAYVIKELAEFTKITLNYNFRVGVSGDKLWEDCRIRPPEFSDKLTRRNLCFTNKKRKEIIELCQNQLETNSIELKYVSRKKPLEYDERQTLKYSMGTPMIARNSWKLMSVAKNELYYVSGLTPLKLYNPENKNLIEIEKDELLKNFLSGYCMTIHKAQGETYKDEYTIHECNKLWKSNSIYLQRLRYTAKSRSSNPEKNILYRL